MDIELLIHSVEVGSCVARAMPCLKETFGESLTPDKVIDEIDLLELIEKSKDYFSKSKSHALIEKESIIDYDIFMNVIKAYKCALNKQDQTQV